MLHSDTLANEFNDILNAVEIFAPFQPLDPAITFYAPLRNNTRDLRLSQDLFERASEAWYKDGSGIYRRAGINQARFEESRLLMEPAQTNKCENYNAEVDPGLSNITLGGTGTLERVEDSAELNAAGFGDIGNGYAVRIASGGGTANANIDGSATNDTHTLSVVIKKIGAQGFVNLRTSANDFSVQITNQEYQRIHITGLASAGSVLQINTTSGGEAFFILNQMEQSPAVTSPIVTEGTAGQRAAEILNYANPDSWFNQSAGMAILNITPLSELLDNPTGNRSVLSISNDSANILYHNNLEWRTYDRVQIPRVSFQRPTFNLSHWVCVLWGAGQFEIGENKSGGGWRWGGALAYTDFHSDNILSIMQYIAFGYRLSDATFYNENKGRAWIEEKYP